MGEFIRHEVEVVLSLLVGVDARIVGHHGDAVHETASTKPYNIEMIAVVGDELVCFIHHLNEFLEHRPLVVALVPGQGMHLLLPGPLPADADNRPFEDDVLVGDPHVIFWPPKPAHVWRNFEIKDEPFFLLHLLLVNISPYEW